MSNIKGGYYIKARKIQNSLIATCPPHVREIWDWLIKEVNHKDAVSSGREIERGECVRTYDDIREGLKWTIGWRVMKYTKWQCEGAMKKLRTLGMITTTKTTRGMVIKVLKYDVYQDPKNYESHKEDHKESHTPPQTTDTINKNDKKEKNDKNNNLSVVGVEDVMKVFYKINPTLNWGNKTNRSSAEFMVKKFGLESTLNMAEQIISIQGEPYAPTATTPYQMKEKLAQFKIFFDKQKTKSNVTKIS